MAAASARFEGQGTAPPARHKAAAGLVKIGPIAQGGRGQMAIRPLPAREPSSSSRQARPPGADQRKSIVATSPASCLALAHPTSEAAGRAPGYRWTVRWSAHGWIHTPTQAPRAPSDFSLLGLPAREQQHKGRNRARTRRSSPTTYTAYPHTTVPTSSHQQQQPWRSRTSTLWSSSRQCVPASLLCPRRSLRHMLDAAP